LFESCKSFAKIVTKSGGACERRFQIDTLAQTNDLLENAPAPGVRATCCRFVTSASNDTLATRFGSGDLTEDPVQLGVELKKRFHGGAIQRWIELAKICRHSPKELAMIWISTEDARLIF
jgi:hypothetical protein